MTDTELKLIAALAIMGLSSSPINNSPTYRAKVLLARFRESAVH